MKFIVIILALTACGPKEDSGSNTSESNVTIENPFIGTFQGTCKYGDLTTVVNTATESKVTIKRYKDTDCKVLSSTEEHTRSYSLASNKQLGGIYDVNMVEDEVSRQVAWRLVETGMIMEVFYWDDNEDGEEQRSYGLMDVVLVRQ